MNDLYLILWGIFLFIMMMTALYMGDEGII